MDSLSPIECEAIKKALDNPDFASGLKKFCALMTERFTVQCRNRALEVPVTVDDNVRRRVQIEQAAAKAKAYSQMEPALRKCIAGVQVESDTE